MKRCRQAVSVLGTVVSIEIVDGPMASGTDANAALERAFGWFFEVERVCSRFDPSSELYQLAAAAGHPVRVSPLLREALEFSLAVAEATGGAFDPTLGATMEAMGFNREHRTGAIVRTPIAGVGAGSYHCVRVDSDTVTLTQPLLLDLGAVAKGLAIDLAARELRAFKPFAIDAGGDLYFGGPHPDEPGWSVGVRHPRRHDTLLAVLRVSDAAVCTSGDYERRTDDGGRHHLVDPHTRRPAGAVASVTVVAPSAMTADALSTAAFVLGPVDGLELLRTQEVEGLIVTSDLQKYATSGFLGLCDA